MCMRLGPKVRQGDHEVDPRRDHATREVDKLCEVCMQFFRHSALSFVSLRRHSLAHTIIRLWARPRWKVRREVALAEKFLVHPGFFKCNLSLGDAKTAFLLTPPRQLTQGKDTWSVPVCCNLLPDALRSRAPTHQHLPFDRVIHDPMVYALQGALVRPYANRRLQWQRTRLWPLLQAFCCNVCLSPGVVATMFAVP